eukprot:TRINITY_DN55665_c0_g1_i1.p1 TRINITY_DN55665_c0_g1~~TRINITY_DN55665_c0_g1_i1.p1  ORF type:complete len:603 (-),score=91.48 TRINITY_DN55665_c0_g1_i1:63-1817(-)
MIIYDGADYTISLIFRRAGSVLPRTLLVAVPAGLIAAVFNIFSVHIFYDVDIAGHLRMDTFMATFTSVMGLLLAFRTQIAYSRFWEGASHLQTIRGGWFNVVSSCFAFCSEEEAKKDDVLVFQHSLIRLMSLLYAAALHEVAVMSDNSLEIIDFEGMDESFFNFMEHHSKKVEILMQWIQRLIVENQRTGTISIAPPILSRVFQELANGIIDLSNAKRICRYPFPFPWAQIGAVLLVLHLGSSVAIAGSTMPNPVAAFVYAFVSTLCLWSMNYVSVELEQPYGDDPNDLPLYAMQTSMNDSLAILLRKELQHSPTFSFASPTEELKRIFWSTHEDPNARLKQVPGEMKHKVNHKKVVSQVRTRNPSEFGSGESDGHKHRAGRFSVITRILSKDSSKKSLGSSGQSSERSSVPMMNVRDSTISRIAEVSETSTAFEDRERWNISQVSSPEAKVDEIVFAERDVVIGNPESDTLLSGVFPQPLQTARPLGASALPCGLLPHPSATAGLRISAPRCGSVERAATSNSTLASPARAPPTASTTASTPSAAAAGSLGIMQEAAGLRPAEDDQRMSRGVDGLPHPEVGIL